MIVRLDHPQAGELPAKQIGGKAHGLARMFELGLPVPAAVVVPANEQLRFDEDGEELLELLGEGPLAVRSSAAAEDTPERSAAGQFESVMGVGAEGLAAAVNQVRRSGHSERARAYTGGHTAMAVVIQREVAATRAGVAFSRDPLTGAGDVLVECVFGHGEQLVSGLATPDRFRASAEGSVRARLAPKDGDRRLLRTLRDDEVGAVADLARHAEEGFGHPVDLEFCFERRKPWLVQCRPITAGSG